VQHGQKGNDSSGYFSIVLKNYQDIPSLGCRNIMPLALHNCHYLDESKALAARMKFERGDIYRVDLDPTIGSLASATT
jgi:hypothetical protein